MVESETQSCSCFY